MNSAEISVLIQRMHIYFNADSFEIIRKSSGSYVGHNFENQVQRILYNTWQFSYDYLIYRGTASSTVSTRQYKQLSRYPHKWLVKTDQFTGYSEPFLACNYCFHFETGLFPTFPCTKYDQLLGSDGSGWVRLSYVCIYNVGYVVINRQWCYNFSELRVHNVCTTTL